jgi:hypothetical protein
MLERFHPAPERGDVTGADGSPIAKRGKLALRGFPSFALLREPRLKISGKGSRVRPQGRVRVVGARRRGRRRNGRRRRGGRR